VNYRYFVAFVRQGPFGAMYGNIVIGLPAPIRDGSEIPNIQAVISRQTGGAPVTIINFRQFDSAPDDLHGGASGDDGPGAARPQLTIPDFRGA
jgi:hypothetical protein